MAPHIFQPKEHVERHLARLQYIDTARFKSPPPLLDSRYMGRKQPSLYFLAYNKETFDGRVTARRKMRRRRS